jgi:hypothetical protein
MSSFVQQLYSIVQYPDSIFQLHDSIILCFFSDVRYRFRTNWQWRYCQHPKCIHNVCLKHPSMSYPLYFINCNKLASEISRRDWHRNVIFGICWDSHDFEPYGRVFSFFLFLFFVFALAFHFLIYILVNKRNDTKIFLNTFLC